MNWDPDDLLPFNTHVISWGVYDYNPVVVSARIELVLAGGSFVRGDADVDGTLGLNDGLFVLNHLFAGTTQLTGLDAGDCDDNGVLEVTDALRLFGFLFLGDPVLPAPMECGGDTTADDLDCAAFTGCS